jgi:hypothetical protein
MISVVAVLDHIARTRDSGGAMRFVRIRQIVPSNSRTATLREVTMGLLRLVFFAALAFATLVPLQAENGKPAPIHRHAPAVLTGKERLGPKWTDEQRIDNCNVPVDKRGNKPRPSICTNAPPS